MQVGPSLRASDADRERAVVRLREATADGRLTAAELEERLEALFSARTYGEIDALLADLPLPRESSRRHGTTMRWAAPVAAVMLLVAMLGMHAGEHRHFDAADAAARGARHFRFAAPFGDPYHLTIAAASMVGVVAVLAACVALAWMLMRSRPGSRA